MPRFDLDLPALQTYRPDVAEPADFDEFWNTTLDEARAAASEPRVTRMTSPLQLVEVHDLWFSGFGGDPVHALLTTPAGAQGPLPTVVEFHGYAGRHGLVHERLQWAACGYAHLFMDCRGQLSVWAREATPDPHGHGATVAGFMTQGILDAHDYYYRRVFTDAVRLVETARTLDVVDADRVAVAGGSQGGGITLAVAGLADGLVAALPDVPFLCHFERSVGLTDRDPYGEILRYLAARRQDADQVFTTLSYFDGINFAKRGRVPALFSTGLMDMTCPPSTVFAARNWWAASSGADVRADIEVYPFNDHEGGEGTQFLRQTAWLADVLGD